MAIPVYQAGKRRDQGCGSVAAPAILTPILTPPRTVT
jgi:hypothetical protein